jgi:hypothetical protein
MKFILTTSLIKIKLTGGPGHAQVALILDNLRVLDMIWIWLGNKLGKQGVW